MGRVEISRRVLSGRDHRGHLHYAERYLRQEHNGSHHHSRTGSGAILFPIIVSEGTVPVFHAQKRATLSAWGQHHIYRGHQRRQGHSPARSCRRVDPGTKPVLNGQGTSVQYRIVDTLPKSAKSIGSRLTPNGACMSLLTLRLTLSICPSGDRRGLLANSQLTSVQCATPREGSPEALRRPATPPALQQCNHKAPTLR